MDTDMHGDELDFAVTLDGTAAAGVLADLEARSERFGRALTGALTGAVRGGKSLEETLRAVGLRLTDMALTAGLKPLEGLLGQAASGLVGSLSGSLSGSLAGSLGTVTPFAKGGVITAPTYFPMVGGAGLMGEAGTEAILPLKRGSDGTLGVAAGGEGQPTIHFHVTATDAASFARSEGQITAMLARSVGRGRRGL
ncbi:phage tail tape measure protein [Peteryoungia desertarenae]